MKQILDFIIPLLIGLGLGMILSVELLETKTELANQAQEVLRDCEEGLPRTVECKLIAIAVGRVEPEERYIPKGS